MQNLLLKYFPLIYIYFIILKKHRASKVKDLFLLPFADGNNQLMLAY